MVSSDTRRVEVAPSYNLLCLLQTLAVVWYIVCEWISDSYVTNFVVAVVLIALDFWTVSGL